MHLHEAFLAPRIDLAAVTPEVAEIYRIIGVHSLLVTVLRVRGESIGTLSMFRFDPASPPFDERDQDMAQALSDHAALAITNARLLQSALGEEDARSAPRRGRRRDVAHGPAPSRGALAALAVTMTRA